jgi:RNA polymerase sigma-70 factor (ECF subfamily)
LKDAVETPRQVPPSLPCPVLGAGGCSSTDDELIRRLAVGDTTALTVVYDRHAGMVFALLVRIVAQRELAEELLQETFLRVWQHARSFDGERGRLRSWLLAIAHHLALNELRRQRHRPRPAPPREPETGELVLARLPDPSPEPPEVAWATVRRVELVQSLERLPEAQRVVIELFAAGYSQSEIATHLGEPLGTVKTRMRRGLLALRDMLSNRGLEPE